MFGGVNKSAAINIDKTDASAPINSTESDKTGASEPLQWHCNALNSK